jgi:hypothetical protein
VLDVDKFLPVNNSKYARVSPFEALSEPQFPDLGPTIVFVPNMGGRTCHLLRSLIRKFSRFSKMEEH